jgi:hypothetical protein
VTEHRFEISVGFVLDVDERHPLEDQRAMAAWAAAVAAVIEEGVSVMDSAMRIPALGGGPVGVGNTGLAWKTGPGVVD